MHARVFILPIILLLTVLSLGCGHSSSSDSRKVSGTVRYEDRTYAQSGFTGLPIVPKAVRFAEIDVVDAASGMILASGTVDAQGAFSLQYVLPANSTAYLRVSAKTDPAGAPPVEVTNLFGDIYAITQPIERNFTAVVDILLPASEQGGVAEAFNILDVLTAGAEFVQHLDPLVVHPLISASWAPLGSLGTYYEPGVGIMVLGYNNFDTDGYDDDVIWHEYGHFVADVFSVLQSSYSLHNLSENDQDLRLSWSEGWADFFPLAVKAWLSQNGRSTLSSQGIAYSVYVDTAQYDTETMNWAFDFGNPPAGTTYFYASSETAVAKVLWDLSGLGVSPLPGAPGLQPVWDVVASFKPSPPPSPVNLESFWDRWLSLRAPGTAELSALNAILAGRGIFYVDDAAEPDNTLAEPIAISVPTTTTRYLYSTLQPADVDFFSFTVIASDVAAMRVFSIFTNNLSNGADTYITIYDSALQKVPGMENDNNPLFYSPAPPNDGTSLSSFIAFRPAAAGTYFIEVKSSPNAPVSAGRYGTYALNIQ